MFFAQKDPHRTTLDHGLVLRSVETEGDVSALAEFNGTIHSEGERAMTEMLIYEHPATKPYQWLFIEDTGASRIAATLCLIPWTFSYSGTTIRSAELGIVGTAEEYRKQGLQRTLVKRYNEIMMREGYEMSHIQGIGYFYRQFGYDYAMPLEPHINIELRSVAKTRPAMSDAFVIRPAGVTDARVLCKLYDDSAAVLDVYAHRSVQIWEYILGPSLKTGTAADTYIVEDRSGGRVGYFRIARQGFGEGIILVECSEMPFEVYAVVFNFVHDRANEEEKPYIRCALSPSHGASAWALDNHGSDQGCYRWQVRIPDARHFLSVVQDVLNQRLQKSRFSNYTGDLRIDLYRCAVVLSIHRGIIRSIESAGDGEAEVIRVPPNVLPMCVLGDRSIEECRSFFPDCGGSPLAAHLFDTLFPKMNTFIHELY